MVIVQCLAQFVYYLLTRPLTKLGIRIKQYKCFLLLYLGHAHHYALLAHVLIKNRPIKREPFLIPPSYCSGVAYGDYHHAFGFFYADVYQC